MKELLFILAQLAFVFGAVPVQNKRWATDKACSTTEMQNTVRDGLGSVFNKLVPAHTDSVYIDRPELKFLLDNLNVYGLNKAVIDSVSVDVEAKIIHIAFHTNFSVRSKYSCYGSLLSKPFYGAGDFSIEMENTLVKISVPYNIINDIHGNKYITLESYDYEYDVRKGAKFDLTNLYYGNEEASKKMHRLMQKNWKILSISFGGYVLDPTVSAIFTKLQYYLLSRPSC